MPERPGGKQMGTTSTGGLDSGANYGNTGKDYGPYSKGPPHQPKGKTTTRGGIKTATTVYGALKNPLVAGLTWGAKKIGNIFGDRGNKTVKSGDTYAGEAYGYNERKEKSNYVNRNPVDTSGGGGGGGLKNTLVTQSIVSSPTADVNTRHQWGFQAYPGTPGTTYNPQAYAKKGKLVRTYATGQEIKNFSKGKRFGPPPLKGPDPQGLQTVLENSDYFKKLIG